VNFGIPDLVHPEPIHPEEAPVSRILGLLLTFTLLTLGMLNGGTIWNFVDLPSFLIVLALPLGMLLTARVSIPTMFQAVFSKAASPVELTNAIRGWSQARTYIVGAGWIGSLVGMIIISHAINTTRLDIISAGIATAILPAFWAIVLSFAVFRPLQYRLEDRLQDHPEAASPTYPEPRIS